MTALLGGLLTTATRAALPMSIAGLGSTFRPFGCRLRHRTALVGLLAPWVVLVVALIPGARVDVRLPVVPSVVESVSRPTMGDLGGGLLPASHRGPDASDQSMVEGTTNRMAFWVVAVWMCGSLLLLVRLGVDAAAARRFVARSAPIGRVDGVHLLQSEEAIIPFAWGMRRPVIVLPPYAESWTSEQRRAVLLHERAHHERRDLAWSWFGRLTAVAFWFHPLVWWLRRSLDDAAEECCDARVLAQGVAAPDYAAAIVAVVRGLRAVPAAAAFAGRRGGSRLLRRVDRVLRGPPDSGRSVRVAPALIVAVAGAVGVVEPVTLPGWLPSVDAVPVTGCDWAGGAHWMRTDEQGTQRVGWEGTACRVEFTTELSTWERWTAAGTDGLVSGDRLTLTVDGVATLAEKTGGALRVGRASGAVLPDGEQWADRLLHEIDLHTAVLAPRRVAALLRDGGVDSVLGFVDRTQGDFAGLLYLDALLQAERVSRAEVRRSLELAARIGQNDAVMTGLLLTAATRYDMGPDDPAYRAAFDRLRSGAARERVSSLRPR